MQLTKYIRDDHCDSFWLRAYDFWKCIVSYDIFIIIIMIHFSTFCLNELKRAENYKNVYFVCLFFWYIQVTNILTSYTYLRLYKWKRRGGLDIDCFAVSVFFIPFSLLQASCHSVKNRGGAISNDPVVTHFGCKQRLLKLNHIRIP